MNIYSIKNIFEASHSKAVGILEEGFPKSYKFTVGLGKTFQKYTVSKLLSKFCKKENSVKVLENFSKRIKNAARIEKFY